MILHFLHLKSHLTWQIISFIKLWAVFLCFHFDNFERQLACYMCQSCSLEPNLVRSWWTLLVYHAQKVNSGPSLECGSSSRHARPAHEVGRVLPRLESTPIVGERGLLLNLSPIVTRSSHDDTAVMDNKENHLVSLKLLFISLIPPSLVVVATLYCWLSPLNILIFTHFMHWSLLIMKNWHQYWNFLRFFRLKIPMIITLRKGVVQGQPGLPLHHTRPILASL